MEWLDYLSLWQSWLAISMLLFAVEILSPTALFLWPALSALGLVVLNALQPLPWFWNLPLFSLSAVLLAYYLRGPYLNRGQSDEPLLNRKSAQLLGQLGQAETLIDGAGGRLKLGDGYWSARSLTGSAIAAGQQVRIIRVEGTLLIVDLAESVLS